MHTRTKALAELKSQDTQFSLGCVDLSWDELKCPRVDMHRSPRQVPCSWLFAFPCTLPTEIPKQTPSLKARHSAAARSSYRGARRCFACFCTSRRGIWPLSPQSGPQVTTRSYSTTDQGAQSDRFTAPSGGQSVSSRVQSFSCPLAVVIHESQIHTVHKKYNLFILRQLLEIVRVLTNVY